MALDSAVRADDDPSSTATDEPRPQLGLVRWGASRWSWYDDTAADRAAPRQSGLAEPRPVGSSAA